MDKRLVALVAALVLAAPVAPGRAASDETIRVVQENRTREPGKKTVRHVAVLRHAGQRPLERLRVTVELYDYFGALLWARTTSPSPAQLRPGDTATVSIVTPDLPAYRRTGYRFEYRSR